mgnify:CR=1 FL=1
MRNYILPFALGMSVSMAVLTRNLQGRESRGFFQTGDTVFVKNAMEGGIAEVMFGNLALEQSTNEPVRQFAKMLVSEHQKANNQLKKLTRRGDYGDLPDGPSESARESYKRISNLNGAEFDKEFAKYMVEEHEKTINVFLRQIESGKDKQLKTWAGKTLPLLQKHLEHARSLVELLNK